MNDYRSQSKYTMNSYKIGREHIEFTDQYVNDKSTRAKKKDSLKVIKDRAAKYLRGELR